MKRFLVDTNIYSYALRGDAPIVNILQQADVIGFTSISIGELLSGFKGGSRERKNREELDSFLDSPRVTVYLIDENTAEYYAEILCNLREIGNPIPTNDIWIAACAFQHGLKLFSRDAHFEKIRGLARVTF
ncbi:MAG: type II toxin-antitoxin system VapC family toxin [Deltaproteobacteria bacterium]|nr:type II toxin-antitoxin system VapC family toxin [Deltaproteobacteria bacterium]